MLRAGSMHGSLAGAGPEAAYRSPAGSPPRPPPRRVDAVVTDTYPGTQLAPAGSVHASTIGHDPVRGYLPEPYLDGSFERIQSVPWVMEPREAASTQWALRVCRELGFEPIIAHE